ncbi:hypothetical protein WDW86_00520 [Bdellovibrionota bacterium FG-2]
MCDDGGGIIEAGEDEGILAEMLNETELARRCQTLLDYGLTRHLLDLTYGATRRFPENNRFHFYEAVAFMRLGNVNAARGAFNRAYSASSGKCLLVFYLGNCLTSGRIGTALEIIHRHYESFGSREKCLVLEMIEIALFLEIIELEELPAGIKAALISLNLNELT